LRRYGNRPVVVGIRPEDMEDATFASDAPPDRRIRTTVELVEALGSDVLVHFSMDARKALTDDVKELAVDVGEEALQHVEQQAKGGRATVVARINPRTRAARGEPLELVVDTTRLHFFDPDTGAGIYGD
jgi:multiple sugar transport system ATP-binding protein